MNYKRLEKIERLIDKVLLPASKVNIFRLISLIFQDKNIFNNPIFVIGTGRSGTGAMIRSLNAHPKIISMRSETPVLTEFLELVKFVTTNDAKLRSYRLYTLRLPEEYFYYCIKDLFYKAIGGYDYGVRYHILNYFRQKCATNFFSRKKYWAAKISLSQDLYQPLLTLYPKAKLVYIVRNGIDVVNSRMRFPGFKHLNFEEQCKKWSSFVKAHYYLLNAERVFYLRHKDLVSDPEMTFKKIYEYLNINNYVPSYLYNKNNLIHSLNKRDVEIKNVSDYFNNRDPVYLSWNSREKEVFKRICSEMMDQYGFTIPF